MKKKKTVKGSSKSNESVQHWRQLAYATALVARMQPNYALFCELTEQDDEKLFLQIIELVWEFISGQNQRVDFLKQLEKLEAITPNPDDFDMYGVWPALDAVVALASLLSACDRWDAAEIEAIQTLSQSTIAQYLEAVGDDGGDAHPLYEFERAYSQHLQEAIEQYADEGRVKLVKRFKQIIAASEVSNIGIVRVD